MTIRIHEASPRALKKVTLEFADGSSITALASDSNVTLLGLNWTMALSAYLTEVELRAPFQERLGLLDSGSFTFTPLQDGYVMETS